MKTLSVICLSLGLFVCRLHAQAPAAPKSDLVVLQNGISVACRIVTATPDLLRIEYRPPGGVGLMSRDVNWTEIRSAEFVMDEEFHALLRATDAAKDGPKVAVRWQALALLLGRPNHPAGELGLVHATLTLANPVATVRARTVEICDAIASGDWNPQRRARAQWLKIQALVSLNRPAEALTEARQVLAGENTDETLAVRALLFVGRHSFEQLRQLQVENPRWQDDDLVVPERHRLFHEAVESSVKPSLFHSTQEETAAEGLWQASEVLLFDGDSAAAANCARDILHLYPKAKEAEAARQLLARLKLPLDVPVALPEMADDPKKEAEKAAPSAQKEPEPARRKRYSKPDPKQPPVGS